MLELQDPNLTDVVQSKEKFKWSQNSDAAGKDADLINCLKKSRIGSATKKD